MKNRVISIIKSALRRSEEKAEISGIDLPYLEVEAPANSAYGDYACNAAMILASKVRQNPRMIAEIIQNNINDEENILQKVQIAGPGFINFFIKDEIWHAALKAVELQDEHYGIISGKTGRKIQVEFVSANPTGPLHRTRAWRSCRRCDRQSAVRRRS